MAKLHDMRLKLLIQQEHERISKSQPNDLDLSIVQARCLCWLSLLAEAHEDQANDAEKRGDAEQAMGWFADSMRLRDVINLVTSIEIPLLSSIVLLPLIGALIMPFLSSKEGEDNTLPRNISLSFLFIDFLLIVGVLFQKFDTTNSSLQLIERLTWLPSIGLEWSLGIDGLSAPLVALSGLITFLSAAASWKIKKKSNLYFALLLIQPQLKH